MRPSTATWRAAITRSRTPTRRPSSRIAEWRNRHVPRGRARPGGHGHPAIDHRQAAQRRASARPEGFGQPAALCRARRHLARLWSSARKASTRSPPAGTTATSVARIERLLALAEYKRRQAPPGVKLSIRNFGRDRRYPDHQRVPDCVKRAHLLLVLALAACRPPTESVPKPVEHNADVMTPQASPPRELTRGAGHNSRRRMAGRGHRWPGARPARRARAQRRCRGNLVGAALRRVRPHLSHQPNRIRDRAGQRHCHAKAGRTPAAGLHDRPAAPTRRGHARDCVGDNYPPHRQWWRGAFRRRPFLAAVRTMIIGSGRSCSKRRSH